MRTNDLSISFLKKGLAVLVAAKDEQDAIALYNELLGMKAVAESHLFVPKMTVLKSCEQLFACIRQCKKA